MNLNTRHMLNTGSRCPAAEILFFFFFFFFFFKNDKMRSNTKLSVLIYFILLRLLMLKCEKDQQGKTVKLFHTQHF